MEKHFKIFRETQELSKKYLKDNGDKVRDNNQKMLYAVSFLAFVIMLIYNVIVPIAFESWHITWLYRWALGIHTIVFALILIRYRSKKRPEKEVMIVSAIFQLYCMSFVLAVSILPLDMEQPAMYFAPMMIGFCAIFIYTMDISLLLVLIESLALIIASIMFKTPDVYFVNIFACLLGCFIAMFITEILYSNRNNESKHRKLLRKMGNTDKLTGINNRAAAEQLSKEYMENNKDANFALMIFDVDHFKAVNDTYGHQAGDVVLAEFSSIVNEAVGNLSIVGRMGGDEFMAFIKHFDRREDLDAIAEQVMSHTQEIKLADDRVHVSCSIGICVMLGEEYMEFDEMFSCADQALYDVKKSGRNNYKFYEK